VREFVFATLPPPNAFEKFVTIEDVAGLLVIERAGSGSAVASPRFVP